MKFSINSANISYLFQKELILRWPVITLLGSLKRWFLTLMRSLAGCSNKFEKPKQDVSFQKGELVMLLRLSLFLCQFETLKLFRNSLMFFINIDLQYELKCIILRLRCICGFMFEWLIIRMFFSFAFFDQYIAQSFTFLFWIIPTG